MDLQPLQHLDGGSLSFTVMVGSRCLNFRATE